MKSIRVSNVAAVFLAILTVISSMPVISMPVSAAVTESGIAYYANYGNSGCVEIVGYSKDFSYLNIPSEIDGFPVTTIRSRAFSNCRSLRSVVVPDTVTSIGDQAFAHCENLESIVIPDSVTKIGGGAFENSKMLKKHPKSKKYLFLKFFIIFFKKTT